MLSDAMEDYLKAIYILQGEDEGPVGTSTLAEYLGKTPPTVTSMVGKLTDQGLAEREKYKGVELTEEGETVALEVLRHHRLLEAYLSEHLDYAPSEVHAEADALEHHISEEFERRVAAVLGDPDVDPHGDPIPGADLSPPAEADAAPLTDYAAGAEVVVARVSDRDDDELAYLEEAGVTPGTTLRIEEIAPFGMVTVTVGDRTQSLPESVASSVRVRPGEIDADPEPEEAA
ncbi:MAG: metal-dependent transcriptional regulator [Haloferacaceae archaeon]